MRDKLNDSCIPPRVFTYGAKIAPHDIVAVVFIKSVVATELLSGTVLSKCFES